MLGVPSTIETFRRSVYCSEGQVLPRDFVTWLVASIRPVTAQKPPFANGSSEEVHQQRPLLAQCQPSRRRRRWSCIGFDMSQLSACLPPGLAISLLRQRPGA